MCERSGCRHIILKETELGSKLITHYREEEGKFIPVYQEFWYVGFKFPLRRTKFKHSEYLNESI